MRKGIFPTARQRVLNRQLRNPAGGRVRLPLALVAGVLTLCVAASVTWAQEPPQPVSPQPTGISPSEPERRFDAQAQELEGRRTELERSLQRAEAQLQQLVLEQDQQRRGLQKEIGEIRERLRDVNSQLADLPRQRLRAKYLAALQTLEQARAKRRQAEQEAEAARLAEQDASILVERLRQLQGQALPSRPEPAGGQPLPETPAEKIEQKSLAPQEPLLAVQQQGGARGQAREEQGDTAVREDSLSPRLESLRGEIRGTGEQMKAVTAQMDATRESLNREISAVRTDVQGMSQTLGRIEQERREAQSDLRTSVEKLGGHLEQMQQLWQTQRALDRAVLQAHRSTVGSAAYW